MDGNNPETLDALLARYAAGVLPKPAQVLVEAHLEMKATNRPKVTAFEAAAGIFMAELEPAPISSRSDALRKIFAAPPLSADAVPTQPDLGDVTVNRSEHVLPKAVKDFIGFDENTIPWKTRLPGFREYDVGTIEGCEVTLMWIRPGRALPAHTHDGAEYTLVIEGAFHDERGRFERGDISIADDTVDHRPVAEKDGPCIAFAVLAAPLKFTGSYRQFFGDLLG